MKVPFGDGVSAIDRTSRAIILLTAQALDHLRTLGWRRGRHTRIDPHPDGMPIWIVVGEERVFEIDFALDTETMQAHGLIVAGRWLTFPRKRPFPVRWWYRLIDWILRRKDA